MQMDSLNSMSVTIAASKFGKDYTLAYLSKYFITTMMYLFPLSGSDDRFYQTINILVTNYPGSDLK